MYNEPYQQPAEPANLDVEGLLRGMYLLAPAQDVENRARAQLLASGVGVRWALEAQQMLADDWSVAADVWSVTSWTELARDGERLDRARLLDPVADRRALCDKDSRATEGPVLATSDYQRAVQNLIAPYVPGDYLALGADGFGFSDTRAGRPPALPDRRPVARGGDLVGAGAARRVPVRGGRGSGGEVPTGRRQGGHLGVDRRGVLNADLPSAQTTTMDNAPVDGTLSSLLLFSLCPHGHYRGKSASPRLEKDPAGVYHPAGLPRT